MTGREPINGQTALIFDAFACMLILSALEVPLYQ